MPRTSCVTKQKCLKYTFYRLANVITLSTVDTKSEQLFEARGIFQNVIPQADINHIHNA
jgi:hypothetical protein